MFNPFTTGLIKVMLSFKVITFLFMDLIGVSPDYTPICPNSLINVKPASMTEWIAHSLINLAAQDQISQLQKVSIHHTLLA